MIFRPLFCLGIWGRKDAFPGADGSTIIQTGSPNAETIVIYGAEGSVLTEGSETGLRFEDITTSGVLLENISLVYTVKNPLTFIYNATTPYDWYTDNESFQNNTLWGDGTDKNAFDPCPINWRVPQDGTWNDFSTTTFPYFIQGSQASSGNYNAGNGRQYNQISWFPATGFRPYANGALSSIGSRGTYWPASVSDIYAKYLRFTMNDISPNNISYRAYGFSVRCIQE